MSGRGPAPARHARTLAAALAFVVAGALPASAGERVVVTTTSGRTVTGEVLSRDDERVTLTTAFGKVEIRADQIARIQSLENVPATRPAPQGQARTDGDAKAQDAPPPAAADAAPAAPVRTAEQLAALRERILEGLAAVEAKVRAAAASEILASWPDSAPILDEALVSPQVGIRLEAVHLLDEPGLGDVRGRIAERFGDSDPTIRAMAVRAARHLGYTQLETRVVGLVDTDPAWVVRREALRALEDVGTVASLRAVLAGFERETDGDRRRSWRRVLVRIVGKDLGDDVEAWRAAAAEKLGQPVAPAAKAGAKPAGKPAEKAAAAEAPKPPAGNRKQ